MTTPPSIPDDALMAYVLGDLDADQRRRVDDAARSAPEILRRIELFRSTVAALGSAGTLAADFRVTAEQRASLRRLGPVSTMQPDRPSTPLEAIVRLIATLVFDSSSSPGAIGYRAAGIGSERLVRFEFPGGGADIRISPDEACVGRHWIIGEAKGAGLRRVVARSAAGASTTVTVAEDGYFELSVLSGEYTFEVQSDAGEILMGPLTVGTV